MSQLKSNPNKQSPDFRLTQLIRHSMLVFELVIVALAIMVFPVHAQTATPPTPRDVLIQDITERAQKDLALGKVETTEGLNVLFGEQAQKAQMPLAEVVKIYEDEYAQAKAALPWYAGFLENMGWAGWLSFASAILLGLIAIFRSVIEDAVKKAFNSMGEALYNQLAGYKPFWRLALQRYKTAIRGKYHELKLPFRPGRPLEMKDVYVPVKVKGENTLADAYQAIEKHKKLVILGAPGAGKSILLRHVALTYAERDVDGPLVPVLVDLGRLDKAGTRMFDQLAAILKQNDFPNGEDFLKVWLKAGRLLIMFDGLDEVNTDQREQVSKDIRDFMDEFSTCHTVITCRTQVYRGEFAEWADQTLEVDEFSDQQIQRFLRAWQPELPPGKSVEHLLANLNERPRIMILARNPLMLTIIAFLYADTEFVLPHSRTEFYNTAVTVLLEQWKETHNRYKAGSKRLVMQHLALFMQDTAPERGQERRTIDLPLLLAQIKQVLPTLNLKDDDVHPLLDEIVERSGLMFPLDGGLKYQFTHLTLQEFFAAHALGADAEGLLRRFKADPASWREVVKLWCGLEHESTHLLNEIYTFDKLTAFESLADAQKIAPELANRLIDEFKERIAAGESDEAILHSIANVAADRRPRGEDLRDFLIAIAENTSAPMTQVESAAKTLAFTNLPDVGVIVANIAGANPNIQPFAVSMGDRIIPALESFVAAGHVWALNVLYRIGTPLAAQTLVPLLWGDEKMSYQVAWRLAALLPQPGIESSLGQLKFTREQSKPGPLAWVWEPFKKAEAPSLPLIAGRVAYLLHNTPEDEVPSNPLPCDPRITLPLCAVAAQGVQLKNKATKEDLSKIYKEELRLLNIAERIPKDDEQLKDRDFDTNIQKTILTKATPFLTTNKIWLYLYSNLPTHQQFIMLQIFVFHENQPTIDDWRYLQQPSNYVFAKSIHAKLLKGMFLLFTILNLLGIGMQIISTTNWLTPDYAGLIFLGIFGIFITIQMQRVTWVIDDVKSVVGILLLGLSGVFGVMTGEIAHNWMVGLFFSVLISMLGATLFPNDYFSPIQPQVIVLGTTNIKLNFAFSCALGSFLLTSWSIHLMNNFIVYWLASFLIVFLAIGLIDCFQIIVKFRWQPHITSLLLSLIGYIGISILLIPLGIVSGIVLGALNLFLISYQTLFLYKFVGISTTIVFWLVWVGSFYIFVLFASRMERRAQNPLHAFAAYISDPIRNPHAH